MKIIPDKTIDRRVKPRNLRLGSFLKIVRNDQSCSVAKMSRALLPTVVNVIHSGGPVWETETCSELRCETSGLDGIVRRDISCV